MNTIQIPGEQCKHGDKILLTSNCIPDFVPLVAEVDKVEMKGNRMFLYTKFVDNKRFTIELYKGQITVNKII